MPIKLHFQVDNACKFWFSLRFMQSPVADTLQDGHTLIIVYNQHWAIQKYTKTTFITAMGLACFANSWIDFIKKNSEVVYFKCSLKSTDASLESPTIWRLENYSSEVILWPKWYYFIPLDNCDGLMDVCVPF